jgi:hypothetical protein
MQSCASISTTDVSIVEVTFFRDIAFAFLDDGTWIIKGFVGVVGATLINVDIVAFISIFDCSWVIGSITWQRCISTAHFEFWPDLDTP